MPGFIANYKAVVHSRERREVLMAMTGGQLLVQLSSLPVTLALPSIARDFGYSVDDAAWIVIANLLVLGSTVFLGARLGDRFGHPKGVLHRRDHHHRRRGGDSRRPGPYPGYCAEGLAGVRRWADTRQWQRHAGLRLPAGGTRAGLRLPHHRLAYRDVHWGGLLWDTAPVRQLGRLRRVAAGIPDHAAHRTYSHQVLPAGGAAERRGHRRQGEPHRLPGGDPAGGGVGGVHTVGQPHPRRGGVVTRRRTRCRITCRCTG